MWKKESAGLGKGGHIIGYGGSNWHGTLGAGRLWAAPVYSIFHG